MTSSLSAQTLLDVKMTTPLIITERNLDFFNLCNMLDNKAITVCLTSKTVVTDFKSVKRVIYTVHRQYLK